MSTHTSADFAEMLGFHQSAVEIRDNVPDSFKIVLPRQLSKDILSPFDLPTGPSTHELYDLQVELDHQSLQRAIGVESAHDATSVANSAKAAALKLAGPLSECGHSGRFGFQQIQFRALIASLALLHHSGVAALDQAPWDKLKLELAARFRSLAYQMKPDTTLADGMRHAANLYLVQVASQYLSFIRRGDSALPLIVGPAFKVFFATIAMVSQPSLRGVAQRLTNGNGYRLAVSIITHSRYSKLLTSCLHFGRDRRPNTAHFAAYKSAYALLLV